MYLFSRRTRLALGNGGSGLDWAASIASTVKHITGHEVQVWGTVYSTGVGTVSFTTWVNDLTSLETLGDKLQADPGYVQLVDAGASLLDGTVDDSVLQPIYGTPDVERQIQYVSTVTAVVASGNSERAINAGVSIAQKADAITGSPTIFVRSLTGAYGTVGWLSGFDTIAALETANNALAADGTFAKLIDSTQGCFVEDPATTQQTIYRRLA